MQSNKKKQNAGITALYCRLSRDDGTECESNSIANQKKYLAQKAKEYGLTNTKYYLDDGYTGTNINRPGFQSMLDDIDMGFVSTIMVKDLSRLGRDYVAVGTFLDSYFPEHGVRFIAVNDMVDSAEGENEIAPFKNVMNEMYARDISQKIKTSHRLRGNMGEPLSPPPYGYMKDPLNKKKWVIDPEAAGIVRDIFRMCIEGKGNETIARLLQERQVLVPMAYWQSKGLPRGGKKTQENPYKWCKSTVAKILAQQEYCGDVINFKSYSKSFKNKTRIPNDPSKWKIFKDVHEPIINRDTFEQVQAHIAKTKRRAPNKKLAEKNMFCDILYCADCGHKMWFNVCHPNTSITHFKCSNYKSNRGTCEGTHYIRADSLETVVLMELKRLTDFLRDDEDSFADLLESKTNSDIAAQQKATQEALQKAIVRSKDVDRLYEGLYENMVNGKVTEQWYMHMSQKYEIERGELQDKIKQFRMRLLNLEDIRHEKDHFLSAIRTFMEMQTLTPVLLRELIEKIEVYNIEGTGKNRTQRIKIHYRFIGALEIPATPLQNFHKLNTRRGVAVEYLPHTVTA